MAIYINTNQNVQLKHEISSISDRLLAYLIDSLIIGGLSLFIFFIAAETGLWQASFLLFGIIFFYHFICELSMDGQSIGKRSRKIRVVKKDGTAATLSAYFLRFLLRPIDSLYGLGLAVIFFTEKGQRLGDLAAGTIVVNVKDEWDIKSSIREEMSMNAEQEVMFPNAGALSDQEVQVIRKVLSNRKEQNAHENVTMLAQKIAAKLDIAEYEWNDYYFLKRLVQDYHQIHRD